MLHFQATGLTLSSVLLRLEPREPAVSHDEHGHLSSPEWLGLRFFRKISLMPLLRHPNPRTSFAQLCSPARAPKREVTSLRAGALDVPPSLVTNPLLMAAALLGCTRLLQMKLWRICDQPAMHASANPYAYWPCLLKRTLQ